MQELIVDTRKGGTGTKFLGKEEVARPVAKAFTSSSVVTPNKLVVVGVSSGLEW